MRTVDEHDSDAPPGVCFQVAADVERWPDILPHYRWVRFRRRDGFGEGLVEMAAWRRFGGFGYPTWWVSEMRHRRKEGVVLYRHVDGITRGMDVVWSVRETEAGGSRIRIVHEWAGPGWPLVGRFAADRIIGPHFVSYIAGRTLEGVSREAERRWRAERPR